jgi:hypothetical protein
VLPAFLLCKLADWWARGFPLAHRDGPGQNALLPGG